MSDLETVSGGAGVTDAAISPSTDIDNPANWDFADPDEDLDNPETEDVAAEEEEDDAENVNETEEETDEESTDEEAEPDDDQDEGEDDGEDEEVEQKVALADGSEVTLEELRAGYERTQDYTRKTTELSERSKALETRLTEVNTIAQAIAEFVQKNSPAKPDVQLAYTDPQGFSIAQAEYEHGQQVLGEILAAADQAQSNQQTFTDEQYKAYLQKEHQTLIEKQPELADKTKRDAFYDAANKAAMAVGFSEKEIKSGTDHRLFILAHQAALYQKAQAEKAATKKKVTEKVREAKKPARKRQKASPQAQRNKQAMDRLGKSGKLEDALNVDFE